MRKKLDNKNLGSDREHQNLKKKKAAEVTGSEKPTEKRSRQRKKIEHKNLYLDREHTKLKRGKSAEVPDSEKSAEEKRRKRKKHENNKLPPCKVRLTDISSVKDLNNYNELQKAKNKSCKLK